MNTEPSPADLYADLRRRGTIVLTADQQGLIAGLRRRAKADGLTVVASRYERTRGMDTSQARRRPYSVSLTADGMHIITPDA